MPTRQLPTTCCAPAKRCAPRRHLIPRADARTRDRHPGRRFAAFWREADGRGAQEYARDRPDRGLTDPPSVSPGLRNACCGCRPAKGGGGDGGGGGACVPRARRHGARHGLGRALYAPRRRRGHARGYGQAHGAAGRHARLLAADRQLQQHQQERHHAWLPCRGCMRRGVAGW
eukprot:136694-Chlamydomonas_euryale.AAC.5